MSAPRLNRALTLEAPARQADGAGGFAQGWDALGQQWCALSGAGAHRLARGGATLTLSHYRITLRASPVGSAMRPVPGQRFRDGSRIFDILAVQEADPDGRYLVCDAQEEVAT
ncbi:head-tail adaptor protein [Cognatishimia sp. SS12]|uniref:head-tail adaptor protein n=1 Tax=Cognatishimia sp. SS12 TaxID=2979465 RepID=UPI00232E51E3|nr:head-tail adaptor protein [Cognatishimia sp. SS12]MDC0737532.1 head-tail adaptor protein [Cognatishimia sp. SS12]